MPSSSELLSEDELDEEDEEDDELLLDPDPEPDPLPEPLDDESDEDELEELDDESDEDDELLELEELDDEDESEEELDDELPGFKFRRSSICPSLGHFGKTISENSGAITNRPQRPKGVTTRACIRLCAARTISRRNSVITRSGSWSLKSCLMLKVL